MATRSRTIRSALGGIWFPSALVVLLLLAVPGAILLALNLMGREAGVNAWLRQNWSITYHLAIPWWASFTLFLVPLLILLLYFLKLKRRPVQVPSTFLWKQSIEDMQVNSLFQWLRRNVLLLIQLLTVLLLIYAVLGIQFHGVAGSGKYYILLIDSSASMSVADVAPSRLDEAKRLALNEIDAHGDGDFGMVIEFNSRAQVLQPYTSDRGLLRAAVLGIRQTQRLTRVAEALVLAESLANPSRSTDDQASRPANEDPAQARTYVPAEGLTAEVHLFSDGRFGDAGEFAAGNLAPRYHRVGAPGADAVDNVGLVNLTAARDDRDPGRLRVFVRVLNYRPAAVTLKVELEWGEWGNADFKRRDQTLTLPARTTRAGDPDHDRPPTDTPGEAAHTFELTELDDSPGTVIRASLRGVDERGAATVWRDAFPLDDQAWLVLGAVRKARVLIVTPGNAILHDFFDLDEVAQLATVRYLSPADLADDTKYGKPARDGAFDLVIFDRCAPAREEDQPLANTYYLDAVPPWRGVDQPAWKRADLPPLVGARVRNSTSRHPLMRHLRGLDEIAFTGAFRFDLRDPRVPARTPRLLETDGDTAVLFALTRRSYTDLVQTFPLVNDKGQWATTWPLKLSFPVFLRNVLYQLGNVGDGSSEGVLQPGQVVPLRPDAGVREVTVVAPDGGRHTVRAGPQPELVYQDIERVGVYEARWEGGRRLFAVNLLDADEGNVQPLDEVQLGDQRLTSAPPRDQVREFWQWAALGALALLLVEWSVYHKRIFT